jgi:hypothetical protein
MGLLKLNRKGGDYYQRNLIETFLAMAYFRIPQVFIIPDALSISLLNKNH